MNFNKILVSFYGQLISLRLGFRRNCLSVLHPNLVSSPIKGILEISMDILAWTDCVRSSAGSPRLSGIRTHNVSGDRH